MKVFIYAYEGRYQGLHGISDQRVVEFDSLETAEEWGQKMAEDVVSSFGLEEEDDEDGCEEEYFYMIWKIREDVTLSEEELDGICSHYDYETFVEEYCEKEQLA